MHRDTLLSLQTRIHEGVSHNTYLCNAGIQLWQAMLHTEFHDDNWSSKTVFKMSFAAWVAWALHRMLNSGNVSVSADATFSHRFASTQPKSTVLPLPVITSVQFA